MDHLKGSHTDECLHVAVGQVSGHIPIVDAFEISVEDRIGQCGVAPVTGGLIDARGIAGDAKDLLVEAVDVASGL